MKLNSNFSKIKTFIFDVDGVFTDGSIIVTTQGEMHRVMSVRDGFAIKQLIEKNYLVCIISGGTDNGVALRLKKLGVQHIYLGIENKLECYSGFVKQNNLIEEEILYMGDDIPDIDVMKKVGLAVCPKDAINEIKKVATYITSKKGGNGCVREIVDKVLKIQKNK